MSEVGNTTKLFGNLEGEELSFVKELASTILLATFILQVAMPKYCRKALAKKYWLNFVQRTQNMPLWHLIIVFAPNHTFPVYVSKEIFQCHDQQANVVSLSLNWLLLVAYLLL